MDAADIIVNERKSIANIYNKSVNAETEDEHRRNMFRTENKKTVALDDIQVSIITKLDEDEPIRKDYVFCKLRRRKEHK